MYVYTKNKFNFLVFKQTRERYEYGEELIYQSFSSKEIIKWLSTQETIFYSIAIYIADKEKILRIFYGCNKVYFVDKKFPEFKQLVGKLKYHTDL